MYRLPAYCTFTRLELGWISTVDDHYDVGYMICVRARVPLYSVSLSIDAVRLPVCPSVRPVPPPRGKTKRPTNTKLGRKDPRDTSTPWTNFKVKVSKSRSRRLIALLAKNPPPPKHAHHVASSSLNDSQDGSTCCRRVVARTYSTARTAP